MQVIGWSRCEFSLPTMPAIYSHTNATILFQKLEKNLRQQDKTNQTQMADLFYFLFLEALKLQRLLFVPLKAYYYIQNTLKEAKPNLWTLRNLICFINIMALLHCLTLKVFIKFSSIRQN